MDKCDNEYQRKGEVTALFGAMYKQRIAQSEDAKMRRSPISFIPQVKEGEDVVNASLQSLARMGVHCTEKFDGLAKQPDHLSVDGIDPSTDAQLPIVLLDLETSGLKLDCNILQIAAICGTNTFDTYVRPTKAISPFTSGIHGLTNENGVLLHNGIPVASVPLDDALRDLYRWLKSFDKQCYIATHNLKFDGPRLYNAITSCSLENDFRQVIYGFTDTLSVIRKHTGRRAKGECNIEGLATWLYIPIDGAHNAVCDVKMLDEILRRAEITDKILIADAKTYSETIEKWNQNERNRERLRPLKQLENVVGPGIREKMILAEISISQLLDKYEAHGRPGIIQLLSRKLVNGKPVVTNHQRSITKLINWIEEIGICYRE